MNKPEDSLYIKILKTDLKRLHELNSEKTQYINKLELALESVERQLENIKAKNDVKN